MGRVEKQVDRRTRELAGEYKRPLERLDRLHNDTRHGETGRLVAKLQSYGPLQGFVVAWSANRGRAEVVAMNVT